MKRINLKQHLLLSFISCLTLGLAPIGDPHILGKLKWVRGGAIGMKGIDWFDLFLHGTPWIYFAIILIFFLIKFYKNLINLK